PTGLNAISILQLLQIRHISILQINDRFVVAGDDVVAYAHGEKSARTLSSSGFQNLTFRKYDGLGHYTIPEETDEVCRWLISMLELDGS
ncbi:unnamed protein product, partial [Coffea canephora]